MLKVWDVEEREPGWRLNLVIWSLAQTSVQVPANPISGEGEGLEICAKLCLIISQSEGRIK